MLLQLAVTVLAQGAAPGLHYDVDVLLEPERKRMTVESVLQIPASTTEDREFAIRLGEQMGVPTLELNGKTVKPLRTEEVEGVMGKKIVRYLAIDPTVDNRVTARYTTVKDTGFVYTVDPSGSFASGSNTDWVPSTDGRVVSSEITVSVPKGEIVKATGRLVRKEEKGDRSVFTYRCEATATLSFASGPYRVFKDESGRLPVALYLFKERPFAVKAVQTLRAVAETLEKRFGPYPFEEMAIVEVDPRADSVAGFAGASLEGFLLAVPQYIDGDGSGPNLAFVGHELAHAWWGHQIKEAEGPGKYMLTEALAQFGALKAVEEIEGERQAAQFRRTGYPGFDPNQSGKGGLKLMLSGFDPPLGQLEGQNGYWLSDRKGFQVYHQLEQVVGAQPLGRAFAAIQRQHAWKRLDAKQFFDELSRHTGSDLDWFYRQWFERPGAPKWHVRWHQRDTSLVVTVEQPEAPFRFVSEVEALMVDGTRLRWPVEVKDAVTELKLPVQRPVQAVFLDPDWDVFHWDPALTERGTRPPRMKRNSGSP